LRKQLLAFGFKFSAVPVTAVCGLETQTVFGFPARFFFRKQKLQLVQ
jgi:hypothetical protein